MKKGRFVLLFSVVSSTIFAQHIQHKLYAQIDHLDNRIEVRDSVFLPEDLMDKSSSIDFTLNSKLKLEVINKGCKIQTLDADEDENTRTYRLTFNKKDTEPLFAVFHYGGIINEEIVEGAAEYARGFSETDGIISPEGIYLAGSTNWVPEFSAAKLSTFTLTVNLNQEWNVVTQGNRTTNKVKEGRRIVTYQCPDPMDEVFLIAGKWTEYSTQAGNVLVQAFLRTPDEELANSYLGVTSSYLDLYNVLIGPYPYKKFALVENFWETGFGMPSFTLLGEKVIRFPWILHSSYPHELLHNYWGNSVYVDYKEGNWCEGITAYMADHLIKEQQGLAVEYRRNVLQKFTDYVNAENDFPPSEFISRNNPAEEAIGYGKVLMFNNMLREEFGDETFKKAYAAFYRKNIFRMASWDDIRVCFEEQTGKDLRPVFDQWIRRKGAPAIEIRDVDVISTPGNYSLVFNLVQMQKQDVFRLNVPVVFYLEGQDEPKVVKIRMETASVHCNYNFEKRPLKVSIDPHFNIMRTLDRSEVPTTLSQLFGAEKATLILPAGDPLYDEYKQMGDFWMQSQQAQGKDLYIINDSEIDEIPTDMAVWILGYDNSFYKQAQLKDSYFAAFSKEEQEQFKKLAQGNSLVYTFPNGRNAAQTIGFVGTRENDAIASLTRKLVHYGNYGYLGFEGGEAINVLKGIFPVLNSKLDVVLPYADHPPIPQKLEMRNALGSVN